MVVRATPSFLALVRHGGGQRWTGVRPPFASPFSGVALTTEIPGGKAIELTRKPEPVTLPGNAATTWVFPPGTAKEAARTKPKCFIERGGEQRHRKRAQLPNSFRNRRSRLLWRVGSKLTISHNKIGIETLSNEKFALVALPALTFI